MSEIKCKQQKVSRAHSAQVAPDTHLEGDERTKDQLRRLPRAGLYVGLFGAGGGKVHPLLKHR